MDGFVQLYKGGFKGFQQYYAILEIDKKLFILKRKSYKGSEKLRIKFSTTEDKILHFNEPNQPQSYIKVYSLDSQEETEFLIIDEKSQVSYKFRAESPFKKLQWLQSINLLTKNLTDDLQIKYQPRMRLGKYKIKGVNQEDLQFERNQNAYRSGTIFSSAQQSLASSIQSSGNLSESEEINTNHFLSKEKFNQIHLQFKELNDTNSQFYDTFQKLKKNKQYTKDDFDSLYQTFLGQIQTITCIQNILGLKSEKKIDQDFFIDVKSLNEEEKINTQIVMVENQIIRKNGNHINQPMDYKEVYGSDEEQNEQFAEFDDQEEQSLDLLFQSIIEEKLITKNTNNFDKFGKTIYKDIVDLKNDLTIEYLGCVNDIDEMRLQLPSENNFKVKASVIFQLLKELIGKDLSKFTMPVWVNEPLSMLQKGGEMMYFVTHYLSKAEKYNNDPGMRMVCVALAAMTGFHQIVGRITKPFNPFLGETYELVTPAFRFLVEAVCHHPPIAAMVCQGPNFRMQRMQETSQKFSGKQINIAEKKPARYFLKVKQQEGDQIKEFEEEYIAIPPQIVVGNLFMGERYMEPQGIQKITNNNNGYTCESEYKARNTFYATKEQDMNFVSSVIKNPQGQIIYKLEGRYTHSITLTNFETGRKQVVYEAPKLLDPVQDKKKIYNMNLITMQINKISDKLKAKLPPTDSRLRPDIRQLENAQVEEASKEKGRLENNQRERRKLIKAELEKKQASSREPFQFDMHDERTFYTPRYFLKEKIIDDKGKEDYIYTPNGNLYWEEREKGTWEKAPRIYEDNCDIFY